jgi:hypothetical protein
MAAEHSHPYNLTADELALIGKVKDAYLSLSPVACTACKYCMPCPNGVDIPQVFDYYNDAIVYNAVARARMFYNRPRAFKPERRADKCIKCEQCLEKCPQKLPIPELLEKAHALLAEK